MAELENRIAQEVRRLRHESELIEARKLSLARVDRPASQIPTDLPRRTLFQSPQQSTPPGFNIPNQSTPPSRSDRFHMPPNHYNNPTTNVMAATRLLTNAPIYGGTPADQATQQAMELLKTAMTQQAQYLQGHSHLHATPYQSMSWQAEMPGLAMSGSHRQHGEPQHPDPQRAVGFTNQPAYPAPSIVSSWQSSSPHQQKTPSPLGDQQLTDA